MNGPAGSKGSARYRVYEVLRRKIVSLEMVPGTALSENELAAALGVSRTPVREALLLLIREGLVEVYAKVGSFVAKVDPGAVAEAHFLREAVEVASLRSIELPLDETALADLVENLDHQDEAAFDLATFFVLDEQFHEGLMGLAGHRGSWVAVSQAKAHLDRARKLGLERGSSPAHLAADHRAILDAVRDGDLDGAEARLREHLSLILGELVSIQAASPELFVSDVPTVPVRRSVAVWQ
jgi:DNA-binding GntR family transcriptional regulator